MHGITRYMRTMSGAVTGGPHIDLAELGTVVVYLPDCQPEQLRGFKRRLATED